MAQASSGRPRETAKLQSLSPQPVPGSAGDEDRGQRDDHQDQRSVILPVRPLAERQCTAEYAHHRDHHGGEARHPHRGLDGDLVSWGLRCILRFLEIVDELAHELGEPNRSAPQQQVAMVGKKGPRIQGRPRSRGDVSQAHEECRAVIVICHNLPSLDPPEGMVQCTRGIEACEADLISSMNRTAQRPCTGRVARLPLSRAINVLMRDGRLERPHVAKWRFGKDPWEGDA